MADIQGPGAIQSVWITGSVSRNLILRMYWDDQEQPAVEVPLPDFFAVPWATREGDLEKSFCPGHRPAHRRQSRLRPQLLLADALPATLPHHPRKPAPGSGAALLLPGQLHPHRHSRRGAAYFHAQFRRTNPVPYGEEYTIVDGIQRPRPLRRQPPSAGACWTTAGGVRARSNSSWTATREFPTICGTGTEDYVGGSYDWSVNGEYRTYTTPFLGMHQVIKPDGHMLNKHRHAMYRFHVLDPIRFQSDLRVTIQDLGFHPDSDFDGKGQAVHGPPGRHLLRGLLVPGSSHRAVPRVA